MRGEKRGFVLSGYPSPPCNLSHAVAPEHIIRVDAPGHIRHQARVRVVCAQPLHILGQVQGAVGSMELKYGDERGDR